MSFFEDFKNGCSGLKQMVVGKKSLIHYQIKEHL